MAKARYDAWLTADGLLKLEAWARDGLTNEQIAHNMGLNVSTLYAWLNKHNDILEALKRGKEVVDIEVENALLKRAKGYKYDEITQELVTIKDGAGHIVTDADGTAIRELKTTKVVTKDVAPDTTAQIYWLKNRKPKEWRDKQDIELSGGGVPVAIDFKGMLEEWSK